MYPYVGKISSVFMGRQLLKFIIELQQRFVDSTKPLSVKK